MIRKVYTNYEEFHQQNEALGTKLPFSENTDLLASEVKLSGKTIPNRFVCQAMEGCDGTPTGEPDVLTEDGCRFTWRPVRPLPEDGDFFENVWRTYRENKNVY